MVEGCYSSWKSVTSGILQRYMWEVSLHLCIYIYICDVNANLDGLVNAFAHSTTVGVADRKESCQKMLQIDQQWIRAEKWQIV